MNHFDTEDFQHATLNHTALQLAGKNPTSGTDFFRQVWHKRPRPRSKVTHQITVTHMKMTDN